MSTAQHSSRKRGLWIAGVFLALLIGGFVYFMAEMRAAAEFSEAHNRIKALALSFVILEETRAAYPDAPEVREIHPGLSWRVAVLPQMGEQELYDEFHLDEPWDSPHNRTLIARMPLDLKPLGESMEPGHTCLVMPVEAQTTNELFRQLSPNSPEALSKLLDRVGQVGRVVEVPPELAVIWTRPDELSITDPRITAFRSSLLIANVAGNVRALRPDEVTPARLLELFTAPPQTQSETNGSQ